MFYCSITCSLCVEYTLYYRIARPMADCMAKEFKVLAARFCPGLSPDDEITKIMKTVKFMLPVFVEEQDYVTEVMLSPRQIVSSTQSVRANGKTTLLNVTDSSVYSKLLLHWLKRKVVTMWSCLLYAGQLGIHL